MMYVPAFWAMSITLIVVDIMIHLMIQLYFEGHPAFID